MYMYVEHVHVLYSEYMLKSNLGKRAMKNDETSRTFLCSMTVLLFFLLALVAGAVHDLMLRSKNVDDMMRARPVVEASKAAHARNYPTKNHGRLLTLIPLTAKEYDKGLTQEQWDRQQQSRKTNSAYYFSFLEAYQDAKDFDVLEFHAGQHNMGFFDSKRQQKLYTDILCQDMEKSVQLRGRPGVDKSTIVVFWDSDVAECEHIMCAAGLAQYGSTVAARREV